MKIVTKEELEWLFTSPGLFGNTGDSNNKDGAHCAYGKLVTLNLPIDILPSKIIFRIPCINNWGDANKIYDPVDISLQKQRAYTPYSSGHADWDQHIRAVKYGLQEMTAAGLITIEDELATEFNLATKSEMIATADYEADCRRAVVMEA